VEVLLCGLCYSGTTNIGVEKVLTEKTLCRKEERRSGKEKVRKTSLDLGPSERYV
jgi:hypothetical protein